MDTLAVQPIERPWRRRHRVGGRSAATAGRVPMESAP